MYETHLNILGASIERAIDKVGEDVLAAELFRRYFERFPETRERYFHGTNIDYFGVRKFRIIRDFLIDTLKYPNYAEGNMCNEVMRHQVYGLQDKEYYFGLIDALMESVQAALADEWSDDIAECWSDVTIALKGFVQGGMAYLD